MMPSPPTSAPLLVALGPGPEALRLVYAGFRMAREQGRPWVAVHVEVPADEGLEEVEMARQWLREAQDLGARVQWVRAPTVVTGLLQVAQAEPPFLVVMGKSRRPWPWGRLGHATHREMSRRSPDLMVMALDTEGVPASAAAGAPTQDLAGSLVASGLILAASAGLASILPWKEPLATALLAFLPGISFVTYRWGQLFGALGLLGALAFYAGTRVAGIEDAPALFVFALLLLATHRVAVLVKRLKGQGLEMRRRQTQATTLYLFGRSLARCTGRRDVGEAMNRQFRRLFDAEAHILVPEEGGWTAFPTLEADLPPPDKLLGLFAPSGDPLRPLELDQAFYLPLLGSEGTEGVLRFGTVVRLGSESWDLLHAFAVQLALSLERLRWLQEAQQARVEGETERTRSALLSAISHDLRTPLAAIQGAASSLLLEGGLPEPTRRDLLGMIQDESQHLTQVLSNLLDLTRLESGDLRVQKEWQPLEEVVGAALGRAELREAATCFRIELPEDLPLVPLDGALMEQVLINLLKNAHRHGGGSPVDLRAWHDAATLEIAVEDRGPGVPRELQVRIFEKFFRLPSSGDGGVGLGLAICKAIVQAHGGRIWMEDREDGGSRFRMSLPVGTPPPAPEEALT